MLGVGKAALDEVDAGGHETWKHSSLAVPATASSLQAQNGYKIRGRILRQRAAVVEQRVAAADAVCHHAGHVELADP